MPEKDIVKAHKRYAYLTFHAQDLILNSCVNHLRKMMIQQTIALWDIAMLY